MIIQCLCRVKSGIFKNHIKRVKNPIIFDMIRGDYSKFLPLAANKICSKIHVYYRPTKSTGPWDRRSQKKIDPRRKFSKLKKKKPSPKKMKMLT